MDLIAALDEVGNEFGRLVDGTRADQLDDRTPCTEFTVRDAEGAPGPGGSYHAAYDFFTEENAPIRAPFAGTIVEVRASRGTSGQIFGGTVKIQSADGRVWVFRHVTPGSVSVGQQVKAIIYSVFGWEDGTFVVSFREKARSEVIKLDVRDGHEVHPLGVADHESPRMGVLRPGAAPCAGGAAGGVAGRRGGVATEGLQRDPQRGVGRRDGPGIGGARR